MVSVLSAWKILWINIGVAGDLRPYPDHVTSLQCIYLEQATRMFRNHWIFLYTCEIIFLNYLITGFLSIIAPLEQNYRSLVWINIGSGKCLLPNSKHYNGVIMGAIASQITSLTIVYPLCGKFTGDRWIPTQMASNAENVSIWWRHHDITIIT